MAEDDVYPGLTFENALRGMAIYGGGDALAALILGEFSIARLFGIALVGGVVFGWEVLNWFRWIDRRTSAGGGSRAALMRTAALAMVYFNPLWIARHLAFIALFSGDWQALGWGLIGTGTWSFIGISPLALVANWLIQNRLALLDLVRDYELKERRTGIYDALKEIPTTDYRSWIPIRGAASTLSR